MNIKLFLNNTVVKTDLEPFGIQDAVSSSSIAARLKQVLAEKQLSESAAATASGMTRTAVTKIIRKLELGSDAVQLDTLRKLAEGLGVSWIWLVTGIGDPGTQITPLTFAARPDWPELRRRAESEITAPPDVWAFVEKSAPIDEHVTVAQVVDFVRLVMRHRIVP